MHRSRELRGRNLLKPHASPHRTQVGETYDSGEFERMLDAALRAADWNGFANERRMRAASCAAAVSVYLEWTGALPTETVDIEIDAEGTVTVFSGTQAMGQGLETTYTQLVEEVLGVRPEKIRIVQGDTRPRRMASAASVRAPRSSAAPRWWRLGAAWCSS